jgi:hypothetical protein
MPETQPTTDFATLAETARYLVIHVGGRDSITKEPLTLSVAMGHHKEQPSLTRVVSVGDQQVCHSPWRGFFIPESGGTIRPGTSDEVAEILDATR